MKDLEYSNPLDMNYLISELGCEKTVKKILVRYASHTVTQLEKLQEAIKSFKVKEIHRISHSIKGGAMNIRALDLINTAKNLEIEAKEKVIRNADSHFKEIQNAFIIVNEYINTITSEK